ncbi:MAG: 4a-hydroxytetrahydrobiopterin dehydratase [Rhodothermales bacterium]
MSNATLTENAIRDALQSLPGWEWSDNALKKTFSFGSFKEAMGFMVRLAFEAEALNHHPELTNVYNRVDVSLTTHDAGNTVTQKDLELANRIESLSWV